MKRLTRYMGIGAVAALVMGVGVQTATAADWRVFLNFGAPAVQRQYVPGHWESQMQPVVVTPGHWETQWVPGVSRMYVPGRGYVDMGPTGTYKRVWVAPQYDYQQVMVWVPGYWVDVRPNVNFGLGFGQGGRGDDRGRFDRRDNDRRDNNGRGNDRGPGRGR